MIKENSAVIYKSKYGASRRYAEWIAGGCGADLYDADEFPPGSFNRYDNIVCLGGIYGSRTAGISIIKRNRDNLDGKKVAVAAVGLAEDNEKTREDILNKNFRQDIKSKINFFMLPGAFDFNGLDLKDKILMSLLKFFIKWRKKEKLDPQARRMLGLYERPADFTSRESALPVINFLNKKS